MRRFFFLLLVVPAAALSQAGSAVSFDGSEAAAYSVLLTGVPSSAVTLELWFSVPAIRSSVDILADVHDDATQSGRRRLQVFIENGKPGFICNPSTVNDELMTVSASNVRVAAGAWYHLAVVVDRADIIMYMNGTPVCRDALSKEYELTGTELFMLGCDVDMQHHARVRLDEVRLWREARSRAELQSGMKMGLTGSEEGLFAYYKFDETAGQYFYDSQVNEPVHNGEIIDGVRFASHPALMRERRGFLRDTPATFTFSKNR